MNVTPISMQMMFPQSNEAGNVQSNLQNQVNIQQSFESIRQKEDAELARQQVRAKEEAPRIMGRSCCSAWLLIQIAAYISILLCKSLGKHR